MKGEVLFKRDNGRYLPVFMSDLQFWDSTIASTVLGSHLLNSNRIIVLVFEVEPQSANPTFRNIEARPV